MIFLTARIQRLRDAAAIAAVEDGTKGKKTKQNKINHRPKTEKNRHLFLDSFYI